MLYPPLNMGYVRTMWARYAVVFLLIQAIFCTAMAVVFDFPEPPPLAKYGRYFLFGIVAVGTFKMLRHIYEDRPENPVRHVLAQDWSQFKRFAGAVTLLWLQWVLLTWGKAMLPLPAGMWADPMLADFERSILGADAWTLLPPAGKFWTAVYQLWAPTIIFTFCWRAYKFDKRRDASLLSIFLIIGGLGTIGQYALPSGGPIFYERLGLGDRFAAMDIEPVVHLAANHLWEAFEGNYIEFATGISAMPSIHVATSVGWAFAVNRWGAWAYPVVIFIGSIQTGWHYALDGIVAAIGAALLFAFARAILSRKPDPARSFA